ncbi:MAG: TMEM14 family protein [Chlamydiia bacterium]|nr:TMEM14 family protein [Chlamydiia bacterium]
MEKRTFKKLGIAIFIYSLLVFSGGVMGFAMKKSMPSLMMGSLFGLSLLYLSVKVMTFHKWGLYTATLLILGLDAFFSYRLFLTKTLFPAGAMLLLTTAILLLIMLYLKKLEGVVKSRK